MTKLEISNNEGSNRKIRFEIQCVADIIKSKEVKKKDAAFERNLLKHWGDYDGYERAKQVLANLGKPLH